MKKTVTFRKGEVYFSVGFLDPDLTIPTPNLIPVVFVLRAAHQNVSGVNQMPGCVLRVSGFTSKIWEFLSESRLKPIKVYFKGEPGFIKSRGPSRISGFNISVTGLKVGAAITKQCSSAVSFIRRHRKEFERMKEYGFSSQTLDFGLYDEAEKHPWPVYCLSPKLVKLAGQYNLSIELSFYGKANNKKHR